MVDISQMLTGGKTLFETGYVIFRLINKFKKFPLTGIYCACWQHNPDNKDEFEVGTMRMYQLGDKIKGEIFAGDKAWPFKALYKHGIILCEYEEFSGNIGNFKLEAADGGLNINRLHGTWNGSTHIDEEYREIKGALFFTAKGKECVEKCHAHTFSKVSGTGLCMEKSNHSN